MSFFKNKHVITAMIVAPVLAIGTYYMVDLAVKEKPQKAQAGGTYKLIAKSNCRFSSGSCDLVNGNFKSTVRVSQQAQGQTLSLSSSNTLQDVTIGFVSAEGKEIGPFKLQKEQPDGKKWNTKFEHLANANTTMRVVLVANDAHYYAETTMGFSTYETSFDKDFRKHN